jgi:hypothetical protein
MSTIDTTNREAIANSGNGHAPATAVVASLNNNAYAAPYAPVADKNSPFQLNNYERFFASLVLISWLFLFAGGILVDTKPYRCVISPNGVQVLADEGNPGGQRLEGSGCTEKQIEGAGISVPIWPQSWAKFYVLAVSWLAVLVFFLPLNLALVCATAGTLGAFGGKANLQDDSTPHNSRDDSNPYLSGLLRGFFVYLFMISGLLLFDDKPFSNPGPGQYIRFAGFLSLFSFVVNYQPYLFTTLIEGAFQRIGARRGGAAAVEATRATVVTDMERVTATTIVEAETSRTESGNGTESTNGHEDTSSNPTPAVARSTARGAS